MTKTTTIGLKDRCIAESLNIIARDGVKNLSIREVARRLGVSHGAPYRHFANRDALITEIAIHGIRLLREYMRRGVDYDEKSPRQNFLEVCHNYILFAMEQRDYFELILWTDLPRSSEEYPHLALEATGMFQQVIRLVRHMKGQKDTPVHNEQLAVLHVISTIHGYASLMSSGKLSVLDYSLDELQTQAEAIAKSLYTTTEQTLG